MRVSHPKACQGARAVGVLLLGALLAGCAPEAAPTGRASADVVAENVPTAAAAPDMTETASQVTAAEVVFESTVDGDTIETSAGTVRIIGIDTPERGECGHAEASNTIDTVLAVGDAITLNLPDGQNDTDRHGRLIRYVTTSANIDVGMLQLTSGNAIARYDSLDGYPAHPLETEYHRAQLATRDADGRVVTTTCAEKTPSAGLDSESRWWEQYTSCTKLKKSDVGDPTGPFSREDPTQADIYEWFAYGTGNNGDGDGDGLACE